MSEHSDSLIAETPQVPWRWLQNLDLCESQAETSLSSQCSFYAPQGWVVTAEHSRRACLPALSIHRFFQQIFLEHFLCARPYSGCWGHKADWDTALSALIWQCKKTLQSVNRKTNK